MRLQSQLDKNTRIDDRNWGLEAGLNKIIGEAAAGVAEGEVARAISSQARRERYRTYLRRVYLGPSDLTFDPTRMLEARANLDAIRSMVPARDWGLLVSLGKGHEYQELGSPGRLRARVLRLRCRLAQFSVAA